MWIFVGILSFLAKHICAFLAVVLLLHVAKAWKDSHGGKLPSNFHEKSEFKSALSSLRLKTRDIVPLQVYCPKTAHHLFAFFLWKMLVAILKIERSIFNGWKKLQGSSMDLFQVLNCKTANHHNQYIGLASCNTVNKVRSWSHFTLDWVHCWKVSYSYLSSAPGNACKAEGQQVIQSWGWKKMNTIDVFSTITRVFGQCSWNGFSVSYPPQLDGTRTCLFII